MTRISLRKLLFVWTTLLVWVGFFCICDWEYRAPYYEARGCASVECKAANARLFVTWAGPQFRHKYGPEVGAGFGQHVASIYWGTYGFHPVYNIWGPRPGATP